MEFHPLRRDVREVFGAKRTTQSATDHSFKQRPKMCSLSFMLTGTVSRIICADFTIWLSISVGSRGPSSQNEHGPRFAAKARERSLPKSMQQSSHRKKTRNVVPTMNCFTRRVPLKPMQQI